MTPDKPKCEHEKVETVTTSPDGGALVHSHECVDCGAAFVPSDVLEALRESAAAAMSALHGPNHFEKCRDAVADILRRIDEVLGK
jgi:hypothetical protein